MALIIFWIKIALRRIRSFFKTSPVTIIWAVIFIGSFIFAAVNRHIEIPDTQTFILVLPLLVLSSLFNSLKNYHVMPVLIKYSKSKFPNKNIRIRFFIKQAFVNNILLLLFNIIIFNDMANKSYFFVISGTTAFSLILSFLLMYLKNNYLNKGTIEKNKKQIKINPVIKSTIYDYLTPNFLSIAVLCAALFLVITVELIKGLNPSYEMGNRYIFIIITVIFSIGFMGVIESIPCINWKYQAIISPNDFRYHIKRTIFFLAGIFGCLLIFFIVTAAAINIMFMLKYLFCIFTLFLASVFTAFTISNMLIKTITLLLILALTVWISTLPAGFLSILLLPVLAVLIKAKNEYREWSLL